MAVCGAKTRSGNPCKAKAMANGRCRMHGGTATGAPKGSQNAATHGIYARFMTPDEADVSHEMELGSVDQELRLTRIRLMRALKAEQEQADSGTLELEERLERDGQGSPLADEERKYKRRDYAAMIDRLTARIESLESRRAALEQSQLDAQLKQLEIDKRRKEAGVGSGESVPQAEYTLPLSPDEETPSAPIL